MGPVADDTAWSDLDRPPLNAAGLRRALVAPDGWAALEVVADTGSTNADLLEAARAGAQDRTVLVAEHQGTGRGRHARTWSSPPRAGLALSVLLRTTGVPVARLGWLPLLAGVAVVDVLRRVAEVDAVLKWPNDVLIGGRKVAGILAEVAVTSPEPAVVVGVGLNVSLGTEELPVPEATSLTLAGAGLTDRDPLLRALLRELGDREREWRAGGGDPTAGLAQDYRARCSTLGQDVRVVLPHGGELLGRAARIDDDGRLVVRDGSGTEHVLSAGDVTHVRLAGR
jgi:BirA family biotin operon repressor/biotin-[acetyl-CoA-carboxylase] ligase